ncbi:exonuclease domain-containing protein [Streptomyces sp. NPDC006798]|uniref:exonuclease domain-containing protein n=1 Tax=Streptomyces sp. NPDC006798 TaxID=3155462 RepID=UPI0034020158
MTWHTQELVGFDLETTGTEPREARIVTAAVVRTGPDGVLDRRVWLADPGIRIPEQAAAIHGITTERATADGRPAPEVADEVAAALCGHWARGVPVVVYNAPFDLTLLGAELDRHGLPSLADRLDGAAPGPVIDPLTVDRAVDRYRRGKRTLEAAAAEYGVALADAHDATADAEAAVAVARALAARHRTVAALTVPELHERQIRWYAAWAKDFESFLRRKGDASASVDATWPFHEPADALT